MSKSYKKIWKQRAIRMSDELWQSLKIEAIRRNIPVSEYIRRIINEYRRLK